nr:TIGR03435 family protein [Flammeovirgaceae bacterium]
SIEVAPGLEDKVNETALEYLNNNFDIYGERKVDSLDCHVLTLSNKNLKESSSEKEEYQFRGDELIAKKIKMERLILYIESMRRVIVADRTGLEGFYDFDLKWEFEKPETLDRELAKYGMELKKSAKKLPVEITEIYKR